VSERVNGLERLPDIHLSALNVPVLWWGKLSRLYSAEFFSKGRDVFTYAGHTYPVEVEDSEMRSVHAGNIIDPSRLYHV